MPTTEPVEPITNEALDWIGTYVGEPNDAGLAERVRESWPALLARVRRGDAAVRVAEADRAHRLAALKANVWGGWTEDSKRPPSAEDVTVYEVAGVELAEARAAYEALRSGAATTGSRGQPTPAAPGGAGR